MLRYLNRTFVTVFYFNYCFFLYFFFSFFLVLPTAELLSRNQPLNRKQERTYVAVITRKLEKVGENGLELEQVSSLPDTNEILAFADPLLSSQGREIPAMSKAIILKTSLLLESELHIDRCLVDRVLEKILHKRNGSIENWRKNIRKSSLIRSEVSQEKGKEKKDEGEEKKQQSIHDFVRRELEAGNLVRVEDVQQFLSKQYEMNFSYWSSRTLMKKAGLTFSKVKPSTRTNKPTSFIQRATEFQLKMLQLWKQEEENKLVVAYLDETAVYSNKSSSYSWIIPGCPNRYQDRNIQRSYKLGTCAKITICLTKYGILTAPFETNENSSNFFDGFSTIDDSVPNSVFVTQHNRDGKSFNISQTSDFFLQYLEKRLVPAKEEMFGSKKMALVLDNAPWHSSTSDLYVTEYGNKTEIVELFARHGIEAIEVKMKENGKVIKKKWNESVFSSRSEKGPSKRVLQTALKFFYEKFPDRVGHRTKVEALLHRYGIDVVYTPPGTPECMPVESLNNMIKRQYAHKNHDNSDFFDLRKDVLSLLFGGYDTTDDYHFGINSHVCRSFIEHSKKFVKDVMLSKDYIQHLPTSTGKETRNSQEDSLQITDVSFSFRKQRILQRRLNPRENSKEISSKEWSDMLE